MLSTEQRAALIAAGVVPTGKPLTDTRPDWTPPLCCEITTDDLLRFARERGWYYVIAMGLITIRPKCDAPAMALVHADRHRGDPLLALADAILTALAQDAAPAKCEQPARPWRLEWNVETVASDGGLKEGEVLRLRGPETDIIVAHPDRTQMAEHAAFPRFVDLLNEQATRISELTPPISSETPDPPAPLLDTLTQVQAYLVHAATYADVPQQVHLALELLEPHMRRPDPPAPPFKYTSTPMPPGAFTDPPARLVAGGSGGSGGTYPDPPAQYGELTRFNEPAPIQPGGTYFVKSGAPATMAEIPGHCWRGGDIPATVTIVDSAPYGVMSPGCHCTVEQMIVHADDLSLTPWPDAPQPDAPAEPQPAQGEWRVGDVVTGAGSIHPAVVSKVYRDGTARCIMLSAGDVPRMRRRGHRLRQRADVRILFNLADTPGTQYHNGAAYPAGDPRITGLVNGECPRPAQHTGTGGGE